MSAIWTGIITPKGKKDYVVTTGKITSLTLDQFKRIFKSREYDKRALVFDSQLCENVFSEVVPVPCGRCIGCRLDYSRSWAVRCLLESKYHENNQFITLTYDDNHLPSDNSVHKRDLQLFFKRIRKYMKSYYNIDNIKYYACGEYGDKSMRPHYHVIFFGLPLYDKKFLSCSRGVNLYTSDIVSKCWPLGIHSVGDVNYETAAYTARYVMKKRKGIYASWYADHNLEPEFVLMSRRPGIGLQYYLDYRDKIYDTDEIIYLNSDKQVLSIKPCSYYDKKYDLDDPDRLAKLKESRTVRAVLHRENVLKYNNFPDDETYLAHEEKLKSESCKILRRNL